MQLTTRAFLLSGAALAVSAASGAFAMGTPSGFAVVGFAKQGDLGEVIVNPYKISPLTAVIKNGGYELLTAHVRVVPKDGGQEIAYDVSKAQLLTHAAFRCSVFMPTIPIRLKSSIHTALTAKRSRVNTPIRSIAVAARHRIGGCRRKEPDV